MELKLVGYHRKYSSACVDNHIHTVDVIDFITHDFMTKSRTPSNCEMTSFSCIYIYTKRLVLKYHMI